MNSPFSPVTSPELITRSWRCRRAANRCVDPWAKCTTLRIDAKGPLATLGDLRIRSFSVEIIVVKAVLRCSMYSLFLFGHDLGSQNTDPELGRIPVLRSLYPGHIYGPWGLRLALGSLGDGYGLEMALSASWQDGQRRLLSIERLVKPLADGQDGATQRWNGQRTSKLPCWPGERPSWGPSWRSLGSSSPDARSTSSGQMPRDRRFIVNIGRTGGFSRIPLPKSGKTNLWLKVYSWDIII